MRLTNDEVRALRDGPNDIAHLALAERLRVAGDSRGECIALDCAIARAPLETPERSELVQRRGELGYAYEDEDLSELRLTNRQGKFHRGFVTEVELTLAAIQDTFPNLDERTPLDTLEVVKPAAKRAVGSPASKLERMLGLGGGNDETASELSPREAMLSAPWVRTISTLRLNRGAFAESDAEVAELASAPELQSLRSLGLLCWTDESFAAETIAAFVTSSRLEVIELERNRVGPAIADMLARRASPLRALRLKQERIGDGGLVALARWPGCASLRELTVTSDEITSEGIRALVAAAGSVLTTLEIGGNPLGPQGALALAHAVPRFAHLRTLAAGHAQIDDDAAKVLVAAMVEAQRQAPRGVRLTIDLQGNPLSPRCVANLAEARATGLIVQLPPGAPHIGTLRHGERPYVVLDDGYLGEIEPWVCEAFEDGTRVEIQRGALGEIFNEEIERYLAPTAEIIARLVSAGLFRDGSPDPSGRWRKALQQYFGEYPHQSRRAEAEGWFQYDPDEGITADDLEPLLRFLRPTVDITAESDPDREDALVLRGGDEEITVEAPAVTDAIQSINEILAALPSSLRWCSVGTDEEGQEGFVCLDEGTARWLHLV